MSLRNRVEELADAIWPNIQSIRRHIHAHPELSFQEHNTMAFISQQLTNEGIAHRTGVADTGIVADIKGGKDGRVVALRADIDALPIQEENQVDYASENKGIMHACGHDVHSASLLGAAIILHRLKDEFAGTVRCIFQPGEEKIPGGASMMIAEGVLDDIPVELIIGQHVFPDLPAGEVGFKPGMYMASADEVYITVKGIGGHAAMPHLNIDPVVISAEIIGNLQHLVSRHAPATIPTVLSFGKVIADGATNVIPEVVKLEGTFRAMNEEWRARAHELIEEIAKGIAKAHGGSCEVEVRRGYPYLENNSPLTEFCEQSAKQYIKEDKVHRIPLRMTGEDFAFYSQKVPACFYRLGTSSPDGKRFKDSVHTPRFDIDEDALRIGAGLMAFLALKNLEVEAIN
ncbi:MAG: amidohydrolase [Flavobacteriales bacterium]|nr:amidohydrolase [Flavobacteriales bacterium]NNK80749.1 amidohydrolase [Flavobacteriales bacterium]